MYLICFQLFRLWWNWVKFVDPESFYSHWYCKMGNYLDVSCTDLSNWLIAAITAERLVVVAFPLKVCSILIYVTAKHMKITY